MTQNHVLSLQKKNPHVLGVGLPPFLVFKVCHLVSKSLYCPTFNPKVIEESNFKPLLIFKCRYKQIYFKIDDVIVGDAIATLLSFGKMTYSVCIDDSNCEYRKLN